MTACCVVVLVTTSIIKYVHASIFSSFRNTVILGYAFQSGIEQKAEARLISCCTPVFRLRVLQGCNWGPDVYCWFWRTGNLEMVFRVPKIIMLFSAYACDLVFFSFFFF